MKNMLNKVKKEPRVIIALINIISFFLPWLVAECDISINFLGYSGGSSSAEKVIGGIQLTQDVPLVIIIYLIALIIIALPFVEKAKPVARFLYLILPVVSIILMFMLPILLPGVESAGITVEYKQLIGFWIAFACNVGCIAFTLVKDYNIKSKEDLKNNIHNINMENISSQVAQVSDVAKEIGSSLYKATYVICPKCGNKVTKGKNFCTKCGTSVVGLNHPAQNQSGKPEEPAQNQPVQKTAFQEEPAQNQPVQKTVFQEELAQNQPVQKTAFQEEPVQNQAAQEASRMQKTIAKPIKEKIRRCENCGREIKEDMKFCPGCGKEMSVKEERVCKKCGKKIDDNMSFCPYCGEKFEH